MCSRQVGHPFPHYIFSPLVQLLHRPQHNGSMPRPDEPRHPVYMRAHIHTLNFAYVFERDRGFYLPDLDSIFGSWIVAGTERSTDFEYAVFRHNESLNGGNTLIGRYRLRAFFHEDCTHPTEHLIRKIYTLKKSKLSANEAFLKYFTIFCMIEMCTRNRWKSGGNRRAGRQKRSIVKKETIFHVRVAN